MLLGIEQRFAGGLHVVVEREIFAADAGGDDARAGAHDFVDAEKRVGGLDHGDELGVAASHAALFFEFSHQFVEKFDVRRAVDLGAGDAVDVGTDRVLEVAHRERQRAVDAYDDVGTAAAHLFGGRFDQRAGFFFLRRRHTVFDVELDDVGAARVRLVHVLVDVDRHVHQGAPYR